MLSIPVSAQNLSLPSSKYGKALSFKDYRNHRKSGISAYTWTLGYNHCGFLTDQFGRSVKNDNISYIYGAFWNHEFQFYPLLFNVRISNAVYNLDDNDYDIDYKIKQRNLEFGANLILDVPFNQASRIFVPYIGGGYNVATLKDSLRIDMDYFIDGYTDYITPTPFEPVEEKGFIVSGPFFKTGMRINLARNLYISGEYMQTFLARDTDFDFKYNYSQWNVGLGFCLDKTASYAEQRRAGMVYLIPAALIHLLLVSPW